MTDTWARSRIRKLETEVAQLHRENALLANKLVGTIKAVREQATSGSGSAPSVLIYLPDLDGLPD